MKLHIPQLTNSLLTTIQISNPPSRDGLTQDDNWYICPHPLLQNLYLATGGSFHGWKFLPILGEYVIRMLDGELSDEEKRRWEWDRELEGLPPNVNEPKRELRDIEAGDGGVKSRL